MPRHPICCADLACLKYAGDPQMAPDGTQALYTIRYTDVAKYKYFHHPDIISPEQNIYWYNLTIFRAANHFACEGFVRRRME